MAPFGILFAIVFFYAIYSSFFRQVTPKAVVIVMALIAGILAMIYALVERKANEQ